MSSISILSLLFLDLSKAFSLPCSLNAIKYFFTNEESQQHVRFIICFYVQDFCDTILSRLDQLKRAILIFPMGNFIIKPFCKLWAI